MLSNDISRKSNNGKGGLKTDKYKLTTLILFLELSVITLYLANMHTFLSIILTTSMENIEKPSEILERFSFFFLTKLKF